ncbi:hypothetical protein GCM10010423_42380 [Streptomyces levis]|uniref:Integrase n=1 Tax=Streptomyces levis TaxID=285566 RepID=A0ABP6BB87_9ACTN
MPVKAEGPYRSRRPSGVLDMAGRTKSDAEKRFRAAHRAIEIREKRMSFPPIVRRARGPRRVPDKAEGPHESAREARGAASPGGTG